jgi:hypothetical protein
VGCEACSCPVTTVGGGALPGDVKPSGLDILWRVNRTYATESYTEQIIFTKACLSYIRDIMALRRLSLVYLLC